MLLNKDFQKIKKQYFKFYKQVLKLESFIPSEVNDDRCFVTINFSNKCNLDCKYCYREKNEKSALTSQSLEEIVKYVKTIYYPNASQYIFSLGYTSESSLDLEKLRYFDYLIGQYEGYLFSTDEISEDIALKILIRLPRALVQKYANFNGSLELLNSILINEKLWDIYDYSEHKYLSSLLKTTQELSSSKRIMVNRQILNFIFPDLCPDKKIHYMSMSFMTNATNITDEYIYFLKSRFDDSIYVSLDGPETVHNHNRVYHNGLGTYYDVMKGIEKLREKEIDVIPAAVITPDYPDLNVIVEHFMKLGFKEISFNLARGKNEITSFSIEAITKLIDSIKDIYQEIFLDFKENKTSAKLLILKNTILFSYIQNIYYKRYVTCRCKWGRSLVIDSKGNIYHCDSTIGIKEDCLGNYHDRKRKEDIFMQPNVNENSVCKYCYAKYLCGGTCYAEQIFKNNQNEIIECIFHKELINESIKLFAKLKNESLIEDFMEVLK
ncbi:MAG: radical SAM protein [Clostridia bacterium]|nr:radical SAM protein [Clostridia bacterium]